MLFTNSNCFKTLSDINLKSRTIYKKCINVNNGLKLYISLLLSILFLLLLRKAARAATFFIGS